MMEISKKGLERISGFPLALENLENWEKFF